MRQGARREGHLMRCLRSPAKRRLETVSFLPFQETEVLVSAGAALCRLFFNGMGWKGRSGPKSPKVYLPGSGLTSPTESNLVKPVKIQPIFFKRNVLYLEDPKMSQT